MDKYKLRFLSDSYESEGALALRPVFRVIYCRSGTIQVGTADNIWTLKEDSALFVDQPVTIKTVNGPAVGWRWEAVPETDSDPAALGDGSGVRSDLRGSYPLPLDANETYSIRCDRVSFPPGGEALTHVHAAPGVRCVHTGEIYIESMNHRWTATPGVTWLERGPDEVYARAWDGGPTSFIRVMLIPKPYFGRSTISYVRPEDHDRPKSQTYHRYLEHRVDLKHPPQ